MVRWESWGHPVSYTAEKHSRTVCLHIHPVCGRHINTLEILLGEIKEQRKFGFFAN